MEVKILHLYHDLLNLYGEYGNINILVSHLKDQNIDISIDKKTINDDFDLNDYDFIYCGSGTESHLLLALEDLKKHQEELIAFVNDNKSALFTGNSMEMLGSKICLENETIDALNIFSYIAHRISDRKTGDVILKAKEFEREVVGFINKQSVIDGIENPLFEVKFGIGADEENKVDGARKNNLYTTFVIGPLLVRNPHVLKYLVEKIIKQKDAEFEIKEIDYSNEEEGYNLVYNELKNR